MTESHTDEISKSATIILHADYISQLNDGDLRLFAFSVHGATARRLYEIYKQHERHVMRQSSRLVAESDKPTKDKQCES